MTDHDATHDPDPRAGTRRLAFAVLGQALAELLRGTPRHRHEAVAWFADNDPTWLFAVRSVCELLALNADAVQSFAVLAACADEPGRLALEAALRDALPHRLATLTETPRTLNPAVCDACGGDYETAYPQRKSCSRPCARILERIRRDERRGRSALAAEHAA